MLLKTDAPKDYEPMIKILSKKLVQKLISFLLSAKKFKAICRRRRKLYNLLKQKSLHN